jgi:hypothetical protein
MPQDPAYHDLIEPLAELLTQFLDGKWDYADFQARFQAALKSYESSIKDRAYWPLDVIASLPSHITPRLREYCQLALERLPKEALDRSTRRWVESTLILNDEGYTCFAFVDGDGKSRFGTHAAIYRTRIDDDSFLLSSLNGTIDKPPFRFSQLLTALCEIGGNELATWVYGTEPDNALAIIDRVWSLGDAYKESHQLQQIERHPAPEGGGSYLMLLPKSKKWMLLNEFDHQWFSIVVHGNRQFIADLASRIHASPEWEWQTPDDGS